MTALFSGFERSFWSAERPPERTRRTSMKKKTGAGVLMAALAFAGTVLPLGDASASDPGYMYINPHQQLPAVNCDHTPGLSIAAGGLFNWGSNPEWLSCPLPADDTGLAIDLVASFRHASANCWVVIVERGGKWTQQWPDVTRHNYGDYPYDQDEFNGVWDYSWGHKHAALECYVPPGSFVTGYYVSSHFRDYAKTRQP
jgi:hypothetical protein